MAYDSNAINAMSQNLCCSIFATLVESLLPIGRKSEAIGSARNAYEDAYQRVQDARAEVDEAEVGVPSQSLIVR